ncbi:MAG TPA: 4'-phosphopantetheinyl transferase superfamily protein [Thermoleophilaceae bacterium]
MTRIAPAEWPADGVSDLAAGKVAVWLVRLDAEASTDVLAPAEQERAARFAAADLSRRWSRARAALRRILAAYAGADPAAVAIEPATCVHCGEPHGKPFLADPPARWLRFNVSHSGELALVAVAHGREVGVDVEAVRGGRRHDAIAERWFAAPEAEELRGLTDAERELAFYRLWARKEAYLKATAEGIAGGLDAFDARGAARLPGWDFADVEVPAGYAGALAVAPPGFEPRYSPGG